ncbi:type 1 fimbrial protein [Jejubacter calystegiae]|uniref:Type 1 fimbrial protein n=1 Tax=Jejubacter calystegiae TaxID=2579935 RepID=A0A4P8YPK2_9ENTR|nr:fimbrial protein [Jejubacter calystegiae]QCT21928.1 type 1 fimbrial protein [Jejubacter calystegiae]
MFNVKKTLLAVFVGSSLMISGTTFSVASEISPMNVNPGSEAGTQGTGGVVNFIGEITDVSCDITPGSKSQTVDLGKWAASYFPDNKESTQTPFQIRVENCPESVSTVAVLFDGEKDAADGSLLAVTGGATGVGVKLYEEDRSSSIKIGSVSEAMNVTQSEDGGEATLTFYADYRADGQPISVGHANAVSNFVMVYN